MAEYLELTFVLSVTKPWIIVSRLREAKLPKEIFNLYLYFRIVYIFCQVSVAEKKTDPFGSVLFVLGFMPRG